MDEYINLEVEDKWMRYESSYLNFFKNDKNNYLQDNCYVIGKHALICDQNQELISNLNHEAFMWIPKWISKAEDMPAEISNRGHMLQDLAIKSFQQQKNQEYLHIKNAIFLLHPFGFYAYGHLYDTLLRLYALDKFPIKSDTVFLISNPYRIVDFEKHLEIILGFKPIILNLSQNHQIAHVTNLVVPLSDSVPVTFTRANYIWLREKYLNYSKAREFNGKKFKLYLSRNHISPGRRSVINEPELLQYFLENQFTILTGNESLSDIVNYFYNAEVVIGFHGSLFANVIFCQADCNILEYCANNRPDFSFRSKYKIVKNYVHELISADENHNSYIDLDSIKLFLKNRIAN